MVKKECCNNQCFTPLLPQHGKSDHANQPQVMDRNKINPAGVGPHGACVGAKEECDFIFFCEFFVQIEANQTLCQFLRPGMGGSIRIHIKVQLHSTGSGKINRLGKEKHGMVSMECGVRGVSSPFSKDIQCSFWGPRWACISTWFQAMKINNIISMLKKIEIGERL